MKKVYIIPETVIEVLTINTLMNVPSVEKIGGNADGLSKASDEDDQAGYSDSKSRGSWDKDGLW